MVISKFLITGKELWKYPLPPGSVYLSIRLETDNVVGKIRTPLDKAYRLQTGKKQSYITKQK
jgi:hypothetical protein